MAIWRTAPTEEQPRLTLISWRVFETPEGDRHLCGYCVENASGRVSSAIQDFDRKTTCAKTLSGRIYRLRGKPGDNLDALYTWSVWAAAYDIAAFRDVSEEFVGAGKLSKDGVSKRVRVATKRHAPP